MTNKTRILITDIYISLLCTDKRIKVVVIKTITLSRFTKSLTHKQDRLQQGVFKLATGIFFSGYTLTLTDEKQ